MLTFITFVQGTLMHRFIKDWTQDFMEAHQGLNHQTILKLYNKVEKV